MCLAQGPQRSDAGEAQTNTSCILGKACDVSISYSLPVMSFLNNFTPPPPLLIKNSQMKAVIIALTSL